MTDEDTKLIFEFCGWGSYGKPIDPEIDLNFLFKYAWDKAVEEISEKEKLSLYVAKWTLLIRWMEMWDIIKDPAEAFGQALTSLIKSGKI